MHDTCMYDMFDDCSHDCPNCPRCEDSEPDFDYISECERERDYDSF